MSFRTSVSPATPPRRKHDPDPRYVPSSQHSQHIMSSPTIDPSLSNASGLSPYHHHHHHHQIIVDRRHAASGSPSFVGSSKMAQLGHAAHGGGFQWVDQTLETSAVNGRGRSGEGWRAPTPDANDHRWAGKKAARDSASGNGSGSGSTVSLSPASFRSPKSVAGSGQIDRGSFQTPSDVRYGSEGAKPVPVSLKGSATSTSRSTPIAKKDYHQYTHHDHLHPVLKASPSNPIHTSLSPIGSSSRKEKIAATKGGHARHAKPSSPSQHPRTSSSAPASGCATTGKGKGKAFTTAAPVRPPHASAKSPLRAGATSIEPFKRAACKPTSLANKPTSLARKPTPLTRKSAPASEAAGFAFSTKSSITTTITTSASTKPTRSAAVMSAFVAAGSFDTLVTSKTQRGVAPKKDPPPTTLFSYMATLDLAKDMPHPRRGWPRPRRARRDGTDGFDILSIVPDHVVPCLQGGRLAYRDASVSASGRVKRGRVYPLYPEKLV
ncbi:hypothetical protein BC937DRAFT_94273 [Endogone sp. FLAS-F59071]|nr:hypothetical protein BC937DRAFT_94273 [Endogone sp. FLAS-F59071]|eukprot:RUS14145.1 hypothetical protein BC937DRAFT_94273 [Endogone sp. FLAS-F59071]